MTSQILHKALSLTLFRQELYFPDVEVGNHWATCDVIIFDVTRLFW